MVAPAAITRIFCHGFLLQNARSSELSSSSPSIATYPPIGNSRSVYLVSPFVKWYSCGPMPMENSGTRIPTAFAVRKWPSSWIIIMTPKIKIANRIVTIKFIKSLRSSIFISRLSGECFPYKFSCLPVSFQHLFDAVVIPKVEMIKRLSDCVKQIKITNFILQEKGYCLFVCTI